MAMPGFDDNGSMPGFGTAMPGMGGGMPGFGRPNTGLQPLAPQERTSFGKDLLNKGQGLLGGILGALNRPGRAVKGVLAGRPDELRALIPFSEMDPAREVTGKKLLQHYGVLRPSDKSWGAWGAGLAADVVTDPLTYASFGAKHAFNAGGRALHRAGELQGWNRQALLQGFTDTQSGLLGAGKSLDDIAHMGRQGSRIASPAAETAYQAATGRALQPGQALSGMGRMSIPFFPGAGFSYGSGKMAQGIAGAMDKGANWARFKNPVGIHLGALFDSRQGRGLNQHTAQSWVDHGTPLRNDLERQAKETHAGIRQQLDELIRQHGDQYQVPITRAMNIGVEQASPLSLLNSAQDPATRALYRQFLHQTQPIADQLGGKIYPSMLAAEHAAGLRTEILRDKVRYGPRQAFSAMDSQVRASMARKEWARGHYGGMDRTNDWVNRLAGNKDVGGSAKTILADMVADHTHVAGAAPTTMEMYGRKAVKASSGVKAVPRVIGYKQRAVRVAKAIAAMDEGTYRGAIDTHPFYTHNAEALLLQRGMEHARTMGGARAGIASLASAAQPASALGPDFVPLAKAVQGLGLTTRATNAGLMGAGPDVLGRLAAKNAPDIHPLVSGAGPYEGYHQEMRNWGIPTKDYEGIAKQSQGWMAPEEIVKPLKYYDGFTNTFKALAYPTWIGSHTRNAGTAGFNNARTSTSIGDYTKQVKFALGMLPPAEANAMRIRQAGAGIHADNLHLSELTGQGGAAHPTGARRWSGYAHATNEHGMSMRGPHGNFLADTAHLIGKEGIADMVTGVANKVMHPKTAPNPFQLAGIAGAKTDRLAPVVAGRKFGSNIENFFRGAQHNGLVRQGYSPEMARQTIEKYHFDYSHLTPFEKKVMRRAMPFYTYTRKNLPLQIETLATQPGTFQTPFRPTRVDRDKQEYTPGYLNNGLVSRVGPEKNGTQRFLTSLGMPQEEAFKEFKLWNGRPDIQGTAMGLAGNLNPILKGPLEQYSGKQFYSGRNLSDLRPSNSVLGLSRALSLPDEAAQPLTQWLANTPATRFLTTADKLLDTQGLTSYGRKPGWATGLNLLTGARISDVDLNKQRYIEQRDANNRLMATQPHLDPFVNYYARPGERAAITPNELLQLRMQAALQEQGRDYLKRQR